MELKPCPFCGNTQPDVVVDLADRFRVACDCGATGPGVTIEQSASTNRGKRERSLAMARWNERASRRD